MSHPLAGLLVGSVWGSGLWIPHFESEMKLSRNSATRDLEAEAKGETLIK